MRETVGIGLTSWGGNHGVDNGKLILRGGGSVLTAVQRADAQ